MGDQGIDLGPAFRCEYPPDRRLGGRIGAEPIDRLGRKGDESAGAQNFSGLGEAFRAGSAPRGHAAGMWKLWFHRAMKRPTRRARKT